MHVFHVAGVEFQSLVGRLQTLPTSPNASSIGPRFQSLVGRLQTKAV